MKKYWSLFFALWLFLTGIISSTVIVHSENTESLMEISSKSGVLMEPETGAVIYEKEKDTRRSPASVTKIMTLLLIFENLEKGSLKLDEPVTTSAHAKSMGGSQVFLEEGEIQTVETLIKCIVIASGNDASVAMAEHIAGSEPEFVKLMNQRAGELGMKNTHFEDCCGLTDSDEHYTTAYDIALMSRQLILKHPQVLDYSSIWMENITHVTRQGSKEFGLTNTNRLIRTYDGCVGLKTGSTNKAGFCLSAVARKNGISLISVVMAAPDYKARLKDAAAMLDYGFSRCVLYQDDSPEKLPDLKVTGGTKDSVSLHYEGVFRHLDTQGQSFEKIQKKLVLPEETKAPVQKNTRAGELVYYNQDKELGSLPVLYSENISEAGYRDRLCQIWLSFLL